MKDLLQCGNRFGGRCPHNDAVGPVEVFDSATIGEKHWLRDDDALELRILQRALQLGGGTDWNRRDQGKRDGVRGMAGDPQNQLFEVLSGIFREEYDVRLLGKC